MIVPYRRKKNNKTKLSHTFEGNNDNATYSYVIHTHCTIMEYPVSDYN